MKRFGMNYWRADYSESCTVSSVGGRRKRSRHLEPRRRPTQLLKDAVESARVEPLRIKIDPGSKTTGLAIVNDANGEVVFAAELTHRGRAIKKALLDRRAVRRSRRQRHTRYRQPRFDNRRRHAGWIPPSLESRVCNVLTWVKRLMQVCPISAISQELVKFDTQGMENPEITDIEYQQGTLMGYELREYLLEKWNRSCAYCGKRDVPLQIEHIHPRAKGGGNRVSNLTLACKTCNRAKGTRDVRVFLAKNPDALARVLAQAKAPLEDVAAVNKTRWVLYQRLKSFGLPVEQGSGGLTKFNRTTRELPKAHWIDAANVGQSTPETLRVRGIAPLLITANGHGSRQMCGVNKHGFPSQHRQRQKRYFGFQTGDMVRAVVRKGKKVGTYVGRVTVRASGSFNIGTGRGRVEGISYLACTHLHRCDGYSYKPGKCAIPPAEAMQQPCRFSKGGI